MTTFSFISFIGQFLSANFLLLAIFVLLYLSDVLLLSVAFFHIFGISFEQLVSEEQFFCYLN
jgi:hypothetical protein